MHLDPGRWCRYGLDMAVRGTAEEGNQNDRHGPSGSSEPCTARQSAGTRPVFPMISLGPCYQLLSFEVSRACLKLKRPQSAFAVHAFPIQDTTRMEVMTDTASWCCLALMLAGVSIDCFLCCPKPRLRALERLGNPPSCSDAPGFYRRLVAS